MMTSDGIEADTRHPATTTDLSGSSGSSRDGFIKGVWDVQQRILDNHYCSMAGKLLKQPSDVVQPAIKSLKRVPSYLRKTQEDYARLMDDFVGDTVHEVRNMLTTWQDVVQKVLRVAPPGSTAHEWQEFILQSALKTAGLAPQLQLGPSNPDPKHPWRGVGYIAFDVCEINNHFELYAHLPGITKEEVKLDVEDDILRLSVEKHDAPEDDDKTVDSEGELIPPRRWCHAELPLAYAPRTIRVPEAADLDQVSAKMQDGVLRLTIAKKEYAIKKRHNIPIT